MSKINNQQNSEEIRNKGENYKMSLDILSSLKSIPGKIIKLQSNNFQSKKENLDKDKSFNDTEEKYSTFNTLSKDMLSNEYYYKKTLEVLCSQNSPFKQYPYYNQAKLVYYTQNYFNYNSLMFLPNFQFSNQNYMIYPYKTLNSVYQMKSTNCFKEFTVNPSNYIINKASITVRNVPVTQIPIDISEKNDDNYEIMQIKNNNFLNKENINKNNINIINNDIIKNNNNNNSILNKKRNRTESNNIYFLVKKEQKKPFEHLSSKKTVFSVYKKSKYIFRKRKKRINNNFNLTRIKINCPHKGCESNFKTQKQMVFHHYKMSIECHNDTISLLKMISSVKKILLKQAKKNNEINENNILEKYSLLYKETMKNIPFEEYIETIVGFNFED
jgi:hypothetical protein